MKSLLPAALAALFMTPAQAQDTTDFTGPYVGLSVNRAQPDAFHPFSFEAANGLAISAGYLFDVGDVLLGGELSYHRNTYVGTNQLTAFTFDGTVTHQAVGLRVGYPHGRVMPYLSARVGQGTDRFDTGSSDLSTRAVAIGAEYAVTDNLFTQLSLERTIVDYCNSDTYLRSNVIALGGGYRF